MSTFRGLDYRHQVFSFQLLKIAQVLGIDDLDQIFEQSKKEVYPFVQDRINHSSYD